MPVSLDTTTSAVSQLPTSVKAQGTTATSSTSSGMGNVKDLSSTFLQLLTQELQNQDPTAPMDSTQMVGQMISLNQLEQLTSINQTLSTSTGSSTTTATSKAVDAPGVAQASSAGAAQGGVAQASSAAAAQAAMQAASMGNTLGTTSALLQNAGLSGN